MLNVGNQNKYRMDLNESNKDADLEFIHSKGGRFKKNYLQKDQNENDSLKDGQILQNLNEYFNFKQFNQITLNSLKSTLIQIGIQKGLPPEQMANFVQAIDQIETDATGKSMGRNSLQFDLKKVWVSQRHAAA